MPDDPLQIPLPLPADTDALGIALAPLLQPGMVVFLRGDLGAGKTALARAILRALGFPGKVKSPTYTLVELYTVSRLSLYHFDFYRFNDAREWTDAGFREYFNPHSVCLVEWPEKAQGLLPVPDLSVSLETLEIEGAPDSGRRAELTAGSAQGRTCLRELRRHYDPRKWQPETTSR